MIAAPGRATQVTTPEQPADGGAASSSVASLLSKKKEPPPDPLLGATLVGKYKIQKKLGEGGMGTVYLAKQMPIDRLVAVKVLLGKLAEDEIAVKRFEQEARAVSKIQ